MNAILTLNAGSSSLKFSLFGPGADGPVRRVRGQFDRGAAPDRVALRAEAGGEMVLPLAAPGVMTSAVEAVLGWCAAQQDFGRLAAVGHRVVHGGPDLAAPVRVDDATLAALAAFEPLAPLHQPANLEGIRLARQAFPDAVQVACFDTAFHRTGSFVAETYALPRRFHAEGVRRYGFHGLSYTSVAGHLAALDPVLAAGRVVIAHLGAGASMCALSCGRGVATTMGFSPLDGLPMGTRCGQIDPGVLLYLMERHGMDAAALTALLYREAGLKGLSGITGDMRTLLASDEAQAAEAVAYFVHHVRREVGALAAVLGGLDALVFTGGIGEHAGPVRAAVCEGLGWMGIALDAAANDRHDATISVPGAPVRVLVVPTDEETVIARAASAWLG